MCALKFPTILVRDKYKMAAICFFKEYVILCILPVTIDFFIWLWIEIMKINQD